MTPSHVSSEDLGLDLQRHAMSFPDHREAVSPQDHHVMLSQSHHGAMSYQDHRLGCSVSKSRMEVLLKEVPFAKPSP